MLKVVVGVLIAVGIVFLVLKILDASPATITEKLSPNKTQTSNSGEPPLKIKSIGVDFSDFKFTKEKLPFDRLFMDYGFVIPANSTSSGQSKANPQPTYVVPLGTPARSLVDGIVAATPTLWSGDFSVQVTSDGTMQKWVYETEHIINLTVKVGDKVSAGQIVGEVGGFDKGVPKGYGVVEIGILKGGNPPEHVCPFAYLDESVKVQSLKQINNLYETWEAYTSDNTLYDEDSYQVEGCQTLDPIPG